MRLQRGALSHQQVGRDHMTEDFERILGGANATKDLFCFDEWAVAQEGIQLVELGDFLGQVLILSLQGIRPGGVCFDVVDTVLVSPGTRCARRPVAITLDSQTSTDGRWCFALGDADKP
jgi:hypothetical protein